MFPWSQFLEDDLHGAIERKVAEVFEPSVGKMIAEWFAIVMGTSLFVLMIQSFTGFA